LPWPGKGKKVTNWSAVVVDPEKPTEEKGPKESGVALPERKKKKNIEVYYTITLVSADSSCMVYYYFLL
jgi:hypothetical protein